jgi:3'-phosphoadenosine 5'-phosphosulfate sulfotransferase (PAPS reductase)/FAD synthetase
MRFQTRYIVALSGGKASAWCANWTLNKFPKEDVILYFNDTKWEHPDLYRFLSDLEKYFDHKIFWDVDGRSPEELFYDQNSLANNRMPFCSSILKAKRLQKFYKYGDNLIFGIGTDESQRAKRLLSVYKDFATRSGKWPTIRFPLIHENVTKEQVNEWLESTGIQEPLLYRMGFAHNNCSGGCVRAGKKQWKLLYEKFPEVYLDRERVEREMREYLNKDVHILSDETLESLRLRIESKTLPVDDYIDDDKETECIGICSSTI